MGPTGPGGESQPGGAGQQNQTPWLSWIVIGVVVVAIIVAERHHPAFLLGVVIFVLALLISVMLHEFGHFATAKLFHMRVTQFFVGFGRTLWSTVRGETEYGVKALPLGGFCRITGMTSMEDVDLAHEPRSFRNQPGWERAVVLAAGSFMHFVLAMILLFILAFGIGQPATSNANIVGSLAACVPTSAAAVDSTNPCGSGSLGRSPAEVAGIRPNDRIISVAGRPVRTWSQLHPALTGLPVGKALPMVVQRDGRDVTLSIKLAKVPGRAVPFIGVDQAVLYHRSGFLGAWGYAGDQFADTLTSSASAIGKLPSALPDLFSSNRAHTPAGQIGSVVGAGEVTGDVVQAALPWQAKVSVVLYVIASLNILVGAFNLLPLLPLDGGHLAVVIFERTRAWVYRLRRRPDPGLVNIQRLVPVSLLVFAVLVGFSALLIAADIFNPVHVQV